jgi:hypothetical protein
VHETLAGIDVSLLARVNPGVLDFLRRDGVLAVTGEDEVFATVHEAVAAVEPVSAALR